MHGGKSNSGEFPMLTAAGLYAAETTGNGDCLFHALSDQLYGDQSRHAELRTAAVQYMREHPENYKPFMVATGHGGRKPKRKNAGALQSPPSAQQVDAQFERHLQDMAQGGTYGDHLEIQAFSNSFGVQVKIWHYMEQAWLVKPMPPFHGDARTLHVAYHDYEHYSTVRNSNGPHTGLPDVHEQCEAPLGNAYASPKSPGSTVVLEPWKVPTVKSSLPYIVSNEVVHRTLVRFRGSVDDAVSFLIENEERSSLPSTPGSSSVEREPDDDADGAENASRAKIPDRRSERGGIHARRGREARGTTNAARKLVSEVSGATSPSLSSTPPSQTSGQASVSGGTPASAAPTAQVAENIARSKAKSRPSASATKEAKKRAQKQAAKERKQAAAAKAKGTHGGPQPAIPTQPFQTLEI